MVSLDTELRRLAQAIAAQAPNPPVFDELAAVERPGSTRRRRLGVIVATALLLAIVVTMVVITRHDASKRVAAPAGESRYDAICRDDPGFFTNANGDTFGPLGGVGPDFVGNITPEMIARGPEFVPVTCSDPNSARIAGWVKADDVLRSQQEKPLPDYYTVYDSDGTTIVGRFYVFDPRVGCGFVSVNEDPRPCDAAPTITGRTPRDVHGSSSPSGTTGTGSSQPIRSGLSAAPRSAGMLSARRTPSSATAGSNGARVTSSGHVSTSSVAQCTHRATVA
jgi:hypothetical protein